MKKVILLLTLLLLPLGVRAQYANPGTVKRAGTHLKVDGEKLSPEAQVALLSDINGTDCNPAWDKASSGRNTGLGLTIGGGVALLGGGALVVVGLTASVFGAAAGAVIGSIGGQDTAQEAANEGASAGVPYTNAGLITAGVGIAAMGVGIPLMITNTRKLNRIVDACNDGRSTSEIILGPTPNGIGIALRF